MVFNDLLFITFISEWCRILINTKKEITLLSLLDCKVVLLHFTFLPLKISGENSKLARKRNWRPIFNWDINSMWWNHFCFLICSLISCYFISCYLTAIFTVIVYHHPILFQFMKGATHVKLGIKCHCFDTIGQTQMIPKRWQGN